MTARILVVDDIPANVKLLEARLRNQPEKCPAISFQFAPENRIDADEKLNCHRMPAPPHIVG